MPLQTIDINGSFEQPWENVGPEQQAPRGWIVDWVTPGSYLWDSQDVAGAAPEIVHHGYFDDPPEGPRWTLPENERPGGPDALILDGLRCLKAFHSALPWGKELWRRIENLEPGTRCEFVPHVQVHYRDAAAVADPWNAEFGCWLNSEGGWNHGLPDREWWEFAYTTVVPVSGRVELLIRSKAKRGNADFFFDNWVFKGVPAQVDPPPVPDRIDLLDYLVTVPDTTMVKLAYSIAGRTGEQMVQGQRGVAVPPGVPEHTAMIYTVKDNQSEFLYLDSAWVYRGVDTSPNDTEFYVPRTGGLHGHRWTARRMRQGDRWPLAGDTIWHRKADCEQIAAGGIPGEMRCVEFRSYWQSPQGPTIPDVVLLAWVIDDQAEELFYYAKNLGLVGWTKPAKGWWSYCCEILENQAPLDREPLPPCAADLGLDQLYFVDGQPEPPMTTHLVLEVPERLRPVTITPRYV